MPIFWAEHAAFGPKRFFIYPSFTGPRISSGSDAPGLAVPSEDFPFLFLLQLLGAGVGFPFFVISATAPLLQKWFSCSLHASAGDPYFLYAASNAGSLLSLVSYPFVAERLWPIAAQNLGWKNFYQLLIVFIALCGIFLLIGNNKGKLLRHNLKRSQTKRSFFFTSPIAT